MARSRRTTRTGAASAPLSRGERAVLRRLKAAGLTRAKASGARGRAYFRRQVMGRPEVADYVAGRTRKQRVLTAKQTQTARERGWTVRKGSVFVPQKPGLRTTLGKTGGVVQTGPAGERVRDLGGLSEIAAMTPAQRAAVDRRLRPDEVVTAQIGGPQGPFVMPPQTSVSGMVNRLERSPKRPPAAQTRVVAVRKSYLERVQDERQARSAARRERQRARMQRRRLEQRRGAFRIRR